MDRLLDAHGQPMGSTQCAVVRSRTRTWIAVRVSRDRTSPDAVLDAGFVRAAGSMIYLVYDAKTHSALRGCTAACPFVPAYKLVWSVNGNDLHFTLPGGGGLAERITKTWHKVP